MSVNKIIIIFGTILVIIAAGVSYYLNNQTTGDKQTLPTTTVTINDHAFQTEIATTSADMQRGLSERKSLPQDQAMLFRFEELAYHTFWTRNMNFPVDILFIANDQVVSIIENAQPQKTEQGNIPLYQPEQPSNVAIEINAGLVKEYGITKGDTVTIEEQ